MMEKTTIKSLSLSGLKKVKLFTIALLTMFLISSCTEAEEDCETFDYATVTVENLTGYNLEVDVTWGHYEYNDERWLSPGYKTTYYEVPTGTIYMWSSYGDGHGWVKKTTSVFSCEKLTYTWYNTSSYNDTENLSLKIEMDGEVVKVIEDFDFQTTK
ncbi:MAG: hypothetical protein ACOCVF_03310 [bacterium]